MGGRTAFSRPECSATYAYDSYTVRLSGRVPGERPARPYSANSRDEESQHDAAAPSGRVDRGPDV
jgi:hypothetical protein